MLHDGIRDLHLLGLGLRRSVLQLLECVKQWKQRVFNIGGSQLKDGEVLSYEAKIQDLDLPAERIFSLRSTQIQHLVGIPLEEG
jgi:hypothetical protein